MSFVLGDLVSVVVNDVRANGVIARIGTKGGVIVEAKVKGKTVKITGNVKGLITCPKCGVIYARMWETLFDVWPIEVEGQCYDCKKKVEVLGQGQKKECS